MDSGRTRHVRAPPSHSWHCWSGSSLGAVPAGAGAVRCPGSRSSRGTVGGLRTVKVEDRAVVHMCRFRVSWSGMEEGREEQRIPRSALPSPGCVGMVVGRTVACTLLLQMTGLWILPQTVGASPVSQTSHREPTKNCRGLAAWLDHQHQRRVCP